MFTRTLTPLMLPITHNFCRKSNKLFTGLLLTISGSESGAGNESYSSTFYFCVSLHTLRLHTRPLSLSVSTSLSVLSLSSLLSVFLSLLFFLHTSISIPHLHFFLTHHLHLPLPISLSLPISPSLSPQLSFSPLLHLPLCGSMRRSVLVLVGPGRAGPGCVTVCFVLVTPLHLAGPLAVPG